jgi:hypothetical protein
MFKPPRQSFTQQQVIELTFQLVKAMRPHVDWSEEKLVTSISNSVAKGLQMAGVELPPWINTETIRKN